VPNVTAIPRGQSNGETITSFADSAETTSRTYTYPSLQNALTVVNRGKSNLTVTVNATPYTITPDNSRRIVVDFTSFSILSAGGTQHFEANATSTDQRAFIAGSVWNGGNLLQLGSYRLFVDGTGKLRMKNGVPASDIDGTIVGTQV
jgi:hypothetical protein